MTSKTFKSFLVDSGSRRLHVDRRPEGTNLWVSDNSWESDYGITIAPSDAPALALAILEAAGVAESSDEGVAAQYLRASIAEQERATAEARERAELEAEALMLANSAVLAVGNPPYPSIEHMSDTSLRKWLAVARRAREIAKEATK